MMTLDQLKNLSDAELNAMVARRKGWKEVAVTAGSRVRFVSVENGTEMGWSDYAPWSSDIADAWGLVEEMPSTTCVDLLFRGKSAVRHGTEFTCEIFDAPFFGYRKSLARGRAATAPRAIVLAWLLAMREVTL